MSNTAYSGSGPRPLCRLLKLRLAIYMLRVAGRLHEAAGRIIEREGGRK